MVEHGGQGGVHHGISYGGVGWYAVAFPQNCIHESMSAVQFGV
jgi:hypothetical protein